LINYYILIIHSEEEAKEAIIYSYNKQINGFAAMLEEEEAAQIASEKNKFCRSIYVLIFQLHYMMFSTLLCRKHKGGICVLEQRA